MAEYDFIKMQKKLAKYLDEDRYAHTLGVMYTCAALGHGTWTAISIDSSGSRAASRLRKMYSE